MTCVAIPGAPSMPLPGRDDELAIRARAVEAGHELYAHTAIGHALGLPDAMIKAIVAGERPEFGTGQEASAYDFTWQLTHHHAVDDATYRRAAREFGDADVVDMVLLTGLYGRRPRRTIRLHNARLTSRPGHAETRAREETR